MGRDGWLAPCWRRVRLNQFIPVPLLAPERCLTGGGDRAGDPRSPCPVLQPLPASVAETVARGARGGWQPRARLCQCWGLSPCPRAVPCHAGEAAADCDNNICW